MAKTFELKGSLVVAVLLLLTGIVGSLFIALGPQATEKAPGVVHIGVRYTNERSLEFNRYGRSGPGAQIELVAPSGKVVLSQKDLQIGRNLMPLTDIPSGAYTARLSAPGYRTRELPVEVNPRRIHPREGVELGKNIYADYNMIGVRFEPVE